LAVAVGIALAAAPTLAHHSRAMFDIGKNITYRGVVEEYRWQNPHSHIVVRVGAGAADRSTVGTWTVEASATSVMTSSGWTPTTYKPGDPNYGGGSSEYGSLQPRAALLRDQG
jgi:hypothetical protein